jgi:hypothetical protein
MSIPQEYADFYSAFKDVRKVKYAMEMLPVGVAWAENNLYLRDVPIQFRKREDIAKVLYRYLLAEQPKTVMNVLFFFVARQVLWWLALYIVDKYFFNEGTK